MFKTSMTFINLPVKDLKKSMDFFDKLGFTFNMEFTDENAASMIINDNTFAMLITESHFKNFTNKEIIDANKQVEFLLSFASANREEVDMFVEKALEAGGRRSQEPKDYGFMYQASFLDLDGHIWEAFYMNQEANQ